MFNFNDIGKSRPDLISATIITSADNIISAESYSLQEIIGTIHSGKTICYTTKGRWSAHDLLAYLLKMTGPADVWFTSWSMTSKPIEGIIKMVQSGAIKSLSIVLDRRVRTTAPEALAMAKFHGCRLRFSDIHAKIMVVSSPTMSIAVVTSQNMTRNKRVEAGVILANRDVALFYRDIIEKLLKDGESFQAD